MLQRAQQRKSQGTNKQKMLKDKNGIIFGVANKRSIAWATAQALHEAGANLAFTYQGDRLKENVEGLTNDAMPDRYCSPAT